LTRYSIQNGDSTNLVFDFRDWKWLSQKQRFNVIVTDPDVLVGNNEGFITIDFSQLEESDKRGDSFYLAGGRAYFEATTLGTTQNSFVTKGFFDKLGY
jgi:predicted methyltransferase